eukprot:gb/GECH01011864.1/.p1 GENE.gb/GECH01011864.1/~~gb/GECH01011864.1/.p1  ORF type:complete len:196 (+),score=44.74 gb/GECH01011864.1/:1-588(+)
MKKNKLFIGIFLILIIHQVSCATFFLDAYKTEYFMKDLVKGDHVRVNWEVRKGRSWNIDAVIYDPERSDITRWNQKSWGSHSFTAEKDGLHQFVFTNRRFDKIISFELELGEAAVSILNQNDPIQKSIVYLSQSFDEISKQQSLLRQKRLNSHGLVEDINERVKWWGIGEAILIIFMSWWQVYYLKKVFVKNQRV